jgi:hypothetical protein
LKKRIPAKSFKTMNISYDLILIIGIAGLRPSILFKTEIKKRFVANNLH